MLSGPICAMVWEGRDAVKTGRCMTKLDGSDRRVLTNSSAILGATNPLASAPGTIRGDYAIVRYPTALLSSQQFVLTDCLGCWPQRLPRLRQRRERKEGDCFVVRREGACSVQAEPIRVDL